MDALFRLRVLIWILVLGLWGVMVYQFLGEEDQQEKAMQYVGNPYKGIPAPPAEPEPAPAPAPAPQPQPQAPLPEDQSGLAMVRPPEAETAPAPNAAAPPPGAAASRSSLDYIQPLPMEKPLPPERRARESRPMRRESTRRADLPTPPGFIKTETRHFNVYSESDPASERFLELLESLHGNLMLDLAAFTPWADDEKVSIFLFHNQDTYRRVTGRPAWSGGASSVPKRKVYVYESEELPGILAHELCHIYYDGFYLTGKPDPLWLSEGMATLIQVERGLAAPSWLRENMEILERGGGYSISELMSITTTAGASDDKVRLWYAQSYSTVRFLVRSQYRSSFYRFSEYLREGRDTTQSLYRAYGMPFNRLKALEYAWRFELANNSSPRAERR